MIGALSVAFMVQAAGGLTPGPADLYVRVVDVGPGLCTITETPNGHYLIYDAGHWQSSQCLAAAREIVDGDEVVTRPPPPPPRASAPRATPSSPGCGSSCRWTAPGSRRGASAPRRCGSRCSRSGTRRHGARGR